MALDNQWLILDNMGKQGVNAANENLYPNSPIGNTFNIQGVAQPQISIQLYAANALFVIYHDGEHYNSRLPSGTPAYFSDPNDQSLASPYIHNLISNYSANNGPTIDHLYLTNIYEGDDLPPLVHIGNGVGDPHNGNYTFGTTNPLDVITTSHSVSPGKDITLVINHNLLLQTIPNGNNYFLSFKDVFDRTNNKIINPVNINLPIFQLSNFAVNRQNSIISQGNTGLVGPGVVQFDPHIGNYTYINLRPATPGMDPFFPVTNNPKLAFNHDYWDYAAVFQVWSDLQPNPVTIQEPIRIIN